MKYLLIDQIRKIRQNLFNFISLSLLVIIIAMTFTAVKSSIRRLDENHAEYLEEQSIEDFYFAMGNIDVSYLGATTTLDLCEELNMLFDCYYAFSFPDDPIYINNLNVKINQRIQQNPEVYENVVDGVVDRFKDEYEYTVEKSYVVDIEEDGYWYKFNSITETINIPYIVDGRLPEIENEIAIFPEFAEANDIELGDTMTIKEVEYTVVGFMYKPEYLFPIFSLATISVDPTTQTVVVTTEDTVRNLDTYLFTKYHVLGDLTKVFPEYGYENIQSNDYSMMGKEMQFIQLLMPSDINFRIITLQSEIINADAFINVFLPLFTALIVMLLVVFMKRYIDKNKQDIKTLHALGYTKGEISLALLLYPFMISLTSIIGYLIGLLVSMQMFDVYSARYLFPKADFQFYPDLILYAVVIPIIAITLINYLFILISLYKTRTRNRKRLLGLFKFVELKTILSTSVLFITISIMIVFGLSGNSMFTAFIKETKVGNHYSEMINLQYMTNTDQFDTYETYTRMPGKIKEVNSRRLKTVKTTTIYGIMPTSQLKVLINDDIENNLLLNDGIIISEYLHTSLEVSVGDTLTFEVGGVENSMEIVGISNELIENNFYMSQVELNDLFQLNETYYNGIFTTDFEYDSAYLVSRIDYNNSLDEFGEILNISSLILNYLIVLSVLMSLFIFSLVIINYFTDRRIEIAILKSIGYNNIEIHKKYLLILYLILLVIYITSIPVTDYILDSMLKMIMDSIGFRLIVDISILNIVIGFIMLHIVFGVTVYYVTKYYDTINVSDLLKHNIK